MIARPHHLVELTRNGWTLLKQATDRSLIAALEFDLDPIFLRTPMSAGKFYGERTKRFGGLLTRSPHIMDLVMNPTTLAFAEHVLLPWCDRIALNLTQAIEIHPGALPQFPHRDHDMWPSHKGTIEYLLNVMWPLTEFGKENGGTRLWPGSHVDTVTEHFEDEAIVPNASPGDALLFLGSTLHGGGANIAATPRRGIVVSYCLGWLKPFELQWLVYPPSVARQFSPELRALVGYAQHRPNLGNVEGQCPSVLLGDNVPDYLPAIDALRPEQQAAIEDFARSGRG